MKSDFGEKMQNCTNSIKSDYDRITTVLSPFTGYGKVPSFVLEKAAERGTIIHKMYEDMSTGMDPYVPLGFENYFNSLSSWMENKQFLFPLDRLYDDDHKTTGLIDGIYEEGKNLVLFDIKTSQYVGKTWMEQLGGYLFLLPPSIYKKIKRTEIIQIDKFGKNPKVHLFENIDENKNAFEACWKIFIKFFKNEDEIIDIEKL